MAELWEKEKWGNTGLDGIEFNVKSLQDSLINIGDVANPRCLVIFSRFLFIQLVF